ncbi:MAG: PadR family transcriptional regulator [Clostridia bacterium]|jgi:DNA-binding PadR family transcriptional regulator|nr:PadR family transcriptional regulator [Clostridia bacterium]
MENVILGLLLLQSRTIYQLRKRINEGLHLMYSCSMGSIQAAIKKLLRHGHISFSEIYENGKLKKIYSITDIGKNYFVDWLSSPIDNDTVKNPELSKIYFLGFAEKETRIKLIENHIADLEKVCSDLEKICENGKICSSGMVNNDIFFYQLQTAIYGRDFVKFNIEWYNRLLNNLRSN